MEDIGFMVWNSGTKKERRAHWEVTIGAFGAWLVWAGTFAAWGAMVLVLGLGMLFGAIGFGIWSRVKRPSKTGRGEKA